jgi:hypothetical protein
MATEDAVRRLESLKKEKQVDEKLTRDMLLILSKSGLAPSDVDMDELLRKFRLRLNAAIARGAL